ncbi:MAG: transglutaminase-like domain-containing protein [Oscillospiraceae bacterium]|nr:transglutaminase-like domain-containing protein [Oscillospiraceae bacterium]
MIRNPSATERRARPKELLMHDGITMTVQHQRAFPERFVRFLITLCGSIGTIWCLQGFFSFEIQLKQLILFTIALTSVMRLIRVASPKIGFGCILAAFASIPLLLLRFREEAVVGAGVIYQVMRQKILMKTTFTVQEINLPSLWTEAKCVQFVFILIVIALVALLEYSDVLMTHAQSSKSGFWIRFFVTFPFLECGLYFGLETRSIPVFLMILFWLGTLAIARRKPTRRSMKNQGASASLQQAFLNETEQLFTTHENGAAVLLLISALLAGTVMCIGAKHKRPEKLDTFRINMVESFKKMTFRDVTGLLQKIPSNIGANIVTDELDLLQNGDLSFDGRTIFHASVKSTAREKDYYMRGLIRSEYTGKGWAIPTGIYRRNQTLFSDLTDENRMPQTVQHSDHFDQMRLDDGSLLGASCSIKAVSNEVMNYVPYEALFPKGTKYRYDIETQLKSTKEYDFWILTDAIPPWDYMDSTSAPSSDPVVSEYEQFVRDTYLMLPETEAIGRIHDAFAPYQPDSSQPLEEKLTAIRDYIWDRAEYTIHPGLQPKNEDFVEYFLTTSHKGFCAHYASAAVLLCRMCGIPARYCQGYVMTENNFAAGRQADSYEIDVPDHQAHAWAEIYIDGYGWYPFEFTETVQSIWHSYSGTPEQPAETVTEEVPETVTQTQTTTTHAPVTTTSDNTPGTPGSKPLLSKKAVRIILRTLGVLLLIAAIVTVYYRFHCKVVSRRNRALNSRKPNEVSHEAYQFLMQLLRMQGVTQNNLSHERFAEKAEEACKLLPAGKITKAIAIQQAAVFSRNGVSAADAKVISQTALQMADALYQNAGRMQKLWLRWGRHIVR